jgi:hypothetical protein
MSEPIVYDPGQMEICEGCPQSALVGHFSGDEPPYWICKKAMSWTAECETMPPDRCPRWPPPAADDDE